MGNFYDPLLSVEALLQVYSEQQLLERGFGATEITLLQQDQYQQHAARNKGFLGGLVIDALLRNGTANGSSGEIYLPVVSAAEALGVDLLDLWTMKDGERQLVVEREENGVSDLYIATKDLHIASATGEELAIEQLALQYVETKNPRFRTQIMEKGAKQIDDFAAYMCNAKRNALDLIEMQALARTGMDNAIENYDPERGKFQNYARHKMRSSILDGMRASDPLSRDDRRKVKQMDAFIAAFEQEHRESPNHRDMRTYWESKKRSEPFESFIEWYPYARNAGSIDAINPESDKAIKENLPSHDLSPHQELVGSELMDIFREELATLPARLHMPMMAYIFDGCTMGEAGVMLKVNESRFSQLFKTYVLAENRFVRTKAYLGPQRARRLIHLDLSSKL